MIVLDTHVLIWSVQDDPKLGRAAAEIIEKADTERRLMIPAICVWEAALLEARGKANFPGGALAWIRAILAEPAFSLAALVPEVAIESARMNWSHKDPADRMIVATARHLRAPLLTADGAILDYAADGHLQAIDARR